MKGENARTEKVKKTERFRDHACDTLFLQLVVEGKNKEELVMKRGYKAIAVTLSMVLAATGIMAGSPAKSEAKAKIKLNKKKVTLTVGKSVKLKLKGTGKKAKWSSSNENVAMVSSSGKVMALKAGKTKITAKIKKKKYSCNVTVKKKAAATPEETARVTPTRMPFVVQTPVPVTPGKTTNAPAATKNPAGTGKPSVSGNPAETKASVKPGTPDDPEETKAPVKPDDPEKPAETKAPAETKTPSGSDETKAPAESDEPEETKAPVKPRVVYQFVGKVTGWGGPDTYPSSKDHEQGDGESNSVNESLTNIKVGLGSYKCGLELMNKYSDNFTGASNEMSQIIKGMTDPVICVTLENGGTASAYNWYDELKCPSGKEVSLTREFLRNEYVGLFGNDDTITKVEIYDRAAAVVEPEQPDETAEPENPSDPDQTKKPEKTAAPDKPSQPGESYTPDIPVVTPGTTDVDNEVLASNMKASIQKLSTGQILLKVVNNNDVTVNYFSVTVTWKDAQGNGLTYDDHGETVTDRSSADGYYLEKNGLYYYMWSLTSENKDKIDLSKSEISIKVDQTYTAKYYSPLTSKITVTSQKTVDEYGDSQIDYEIKNDDSKEARIWMVVLYKDAKGNVIGTEWNFETPKAGETISDYMYTPYDENGDEHIDFASYEIYINGYMYDSES